MLQRRQQRILADTLVAAQHQGVVDLLGWALHPVRAPLLDVSGFVWIDAFQMPAPQRDIIRNPAHDRRFVQIETTNPRSFDPSAIGEQLALDVDWLAWRPGHLFDMAIDVEPGARLQFADPG